LQAAIVLGENDSSSELLSWSAAAKGREGWFKRLESGRSRLLLNDRDVIFSAAKPKRQDRVLIPMASDGLLLWESLRRCPEGLSAGVVSTNEAGEALLSYAKVLEDTEKPQIAVIKEKILPDIKQCEENFSCSEFDHILLRASRLNISGMNINFDALAADAKSLLAKNGNFIILCSPPRLGEKISRLLNEECSQNKLAKKLEKAEAAFFKDTSKVDLWDENELIAALEKQGFTVSSQEIDQKEERLITEKDLSAWFNTEQSRWGSFMEKTLEKEDFSAIEDALRLRISKGPLLWRWKSLCIKSNL